MRNQYNLKPIDATSSTTNSRSSPENSNTNTNGDSQHKKSSEGKRLVGLKGKLHNLVASKLTNHLSLSLSAHQERSDQCESQSRSQATNLLRNAKILATSGGQNPHQQNPLERKMIHHHHHHKQLGGLSRAQLTSQATRTQQATGNRLSPAEFNARRLLQQQHYHLPPQNATSSQVSAHSSEKISPELAKCYDEIDQIYDYIRGLAPLPLQLRKIKSIDFELLEASEKRLARQQQQAALLHRNRLQQLAKSSQSSSNSNGPSGSDKSASSSAGSTAANQRATKPAKLRQRDASPEAKRRGLVQGPLPIKVVTSALSHQNKPNVKRVESLNLGRSADGERLESTSGKQPQQSQLTRPSYLISSPQRGQLFRLPRAHSTSTLNKPGESSDRLTVAAAAKVANANAAQLDDEKRKQNYTRTLPSLRNASRVLPADQFQSESQRMSNSLGRLRTRLFNLDQQPADTRANQSIDLVESYVDDDDDDESDDSGENLRNKQPDCDRKSMTTSDNSSHQVTTSNLRANSKSRSQSEQRSRNYTRNLAPKLAASDPQSSDTSSASTSAASSSEQLNSSNSPDKLTRRKSSSCGEKLTEKSHSDYENESASLSDEQQQDEATSSATSSTSGSQSSETSSSSATSSSSSSSSSPSRSASDLNDKQTNDGSQTANMRLTGAQQPPVESYRRQQPPRISNSSSSSTKYPVAYAPNMAANSKPAGFLKTSGGAAPRVSGSAQYPSLPMASLRPNGHQYSTSGSRNMAAYQQARPLDHRYRLSVGNLHLIPYLTPSQPAMLHQYPVQIRQHHMAMEPANFQQQLNRSSSSSKVNRIRAPRLSPGQLIANIQMPRAVNKRQQVPSRSSQPAKPQQLYVWPSTIHPVGGQNIKAEINPFASRQRGSARRLTAIGIEDALGYPPTSAAQAAAASGSMGRRMSEQQQQQQQQQVAGAKTHNIKYFEPPQLMKAPLIDDDEGESPDHRHENDKKRSTRLRQQLNSISDLHSFSSTEDSQDEGQSTSGSRSHELTTNAEQSSKFDDESNFVSSRSFIKCYYGKEQPAATGEGRRREGERESDKTRDEEKKSHSHKPTSRKLLGLIGLDKTSSSSDNGERKSGEQVAVPSRRQQQQQQQLKQRPQLKEVTRAPRKQVKSPIVGELFVSSTTAANPTTRPHASSGNPPASSKLVGEFLNAEGPILVRDRRIAALRSDLVRHYQHPTVQVAKVPGYHHHHHSLVSSTGSSQQVAAGKRLQVASNLNSNSNTNTTNSTSSYEAAMKNSRSVETSATHQQLAAVQSPEVEGTLTSIRSSKLSSTGERVRKTRPTQVSSTQSSAQVASSTLIKVPKLSKQSHLLNRPLPRPPASQMNSLPRRHITAVSSSAQQQNSASKTQATNREPPTSRMVSATLQQTVKSAQRPLKALVSTNLDSPTLMVTSSSSLSRPKSSKTTAATTTTSTPMPLTNVQPSPTVTTYTSSGISSRLTSATHLASTASSTGGSSGGRPRSVGSRRRASGATNNSNGGTSNSNGPDESQNTGDSASFKSLASADANKRQQSHDRRHHLSSKPARDPLGFKSSDDFELMDGDEDVGVDSRRESRHRRRQIGLDNKENSGNTLEDQQQPQVAMSNNLRLFDERFSSKFMDKHLASSDDSLLESINFSGTLNSQRKSTSASQQQQQQPVRH